GCVLPGKDVKDIPIPPGQSFTYSWTLTAEDGPTQADPRCLTRFYYSSIDPVRDTASGLIGPLLICSKKSMDQRGNQVGLSFLVLFSVFDENHSWYLEENIRRFCSDAAHVDTQDPQFYASNVMHTINGYVSDTLPGLVMAQQQRVRWHLLNMGSTEDIHSVHFHGQLFSVRTSQEYRMGVYNLYPGEIQLRHRAPPLPGLHVCVLRKSLQE
ncbi:FA8 factor, partial [Picathartes gymnocephalus]|nr:FA8 factor [Picathartes gymnocephalus]